MVRTHRNIN